MSPEGRDRGRVIGSMSASSGLRRSAQPHGVIKQSRRYDGFCHRPGGRQVSRDQCKPNQTSCTGDTQFTCDADGNWPTTGSTCPYVCRNNACAGQCKPYQTSCAGGQLVFPILPA